MKTKFALLICMISALIFAMYSLNFFPRDSSHPENRILRFGHDMPENSPQHQGALKFKELVEKKTEGRLQIRIFPSQKLGTDAEMVDMVQRGDLAFSLPPTSKISALDPLLEIFDIPFLFKNSESLYEELDGKTGSSLFQGLRNQHIEALSMWESGFKHFTGNKPLLTPSDFNGLRFRVMRSSVLNDQAISLNAFPEFVDFHKLRDALISGVIDCEENSISSIVSMKLYNGQKYLTISNHGYLGQLLIASQKIMETLTEKDKDIIFTAARSAAYYQRSQVRKNEEIFLDELKHQGINIVSLSKEQRSEFIKSFAPIYFENRTTLRKFSAFINPDILPFLEPHIVVFLDLSFTYENYASAVSLKRGAELAVEEINQNGGLFGKKILLMAKSHDGFPARGIKNISEISKNHHPVAILGGMHSPVILAEQETINQIKVPYLVPWAAATSIVSKLNPFIFRYSVRDSDAGEKLLRMASKSGKHVYLLLEETPWGRSNEKSIYKALKKIKGTSVSGVRWFKWGKTNFNDVVEDIVQSESDVVIYIGNAPEAVHFVRGFVNHHLNIPIVSHWGLTGGRFWNETKDILNRVKLNFLVTKAGLQKNPSQRFTHFMNLYHKKYHTDRTQHIPAIYGTVHAYELMKILFFSMKKSVSENPEHIMNAMRSIREYDGIYRKHTNLFNKKSREQEALKESDLAFGYYNHIGNLTIDE
ncbi:MAG: DctP family TRAP transporter solute-binding subunit [Deltaproteobacteria bacterium]|nr:DctP family TRAP transporter solute-binding subunit [Deltaproteobacteria bacterium]